MALKLYNTLTRQKAEFEPIDPKNVRMYVCGPTVYDYAHIGNARPVIVFDVLFRLLRHVYGPEHVTYVRNITDVDDKINARAARDYPDLPLNDAIRKVTEATEKQFHEDIAALGVLPPTFEPRATEYIRRDDGRETMVSLIETLVQRGNAYVAEDHVLFDVASMPDYGRLSNRSLDEMEAGARVEVAPYKKGPMDFVLWKPSKPGEPAWSSPCGIATLGRPGWHIECSAMAGALLGPEFDIHGGGIDLTFPHHENEIAQSRCAHGTAAMANVWMHNGFLQVEGEKMSKSLGNFVTINELLGQFHGTVLRLNMLRTHYRQPIDWQRKELERSRHELWNWAHIVSDNGVEKYYETPDRDLVDTTFVAALEDDLNTPFAIARLHEIASASRTNREAAKIFASAAGFLGLKDLDKPQYFTDVIASYIPEDREADYKKSHASLVHFKNYSANGAISVAETYRRDALSHGVVVRIETDTVQINFAGGEDKEPTETRVKRLVDARLDARKRKDFAESDRIRDELAKMGISLKDTKNKETGEIETTWEVSR
ncbi:MAG: cysteine--tRNA ligase [Hyphomicrobium sp.]|uniref:cysteine--tRNA ligase n=1 Tax=Hyphomicrobium sp. TaxID=82 RepID=UPI00356661CE